MLENVKEKIVKSQVFRSIFRHGFPDNDLNRAYVVFSNVFLHIHPVKVRRSALRMRYTFCLGGITLFLFIMLTVTGIWLMFYYTPYTGLAYSNIQDIQFVIFGGNLMRDLHRFAAHGMVLFVWLHMTRVFLTGAYKAPREFNWVVGVVLLVNTLILSWTGYLLPWDQLAYWAVTVGTKMASYTPFIGQNGPWGTQLGFLPTNDIMFMLIGGTVVGQNALIRFYVLHCVVLPLVVTVFLAVHFWRIRKDGFSGPL